MKTIVSVDSNLKTELEGDEWFQLCDKEGYLPKNEKERAEILAELGFTADQFEAIENAFNYARERIVDNLHKDLSDIWERIDALEKKLDE